MQQYLLPIADRDALVWIVREQMTAFGANRAREANGLEPGDVLFLYSTRGCFRNPTRDRGRVFGRALVTRGVDSSAQTVTFGGREFPIVVPLRIEPLCPYRTGVALAPLVPQLRSTFPDPATWSIRIRRALVPLAPDDAQIVEAALAVEASNYRSAAGSYADR